MAEIHRILRPGGIFIATTFLNPQSPVADDIIKPLRKVGVGLGHAVRHCVVEGMLEVLFRSCGVASCSANVPAN